MEQSEAVKAYTRGREDASESGDRMGYAQKVLVAIATGMAAQLTELRQVHYHPPVEEAERAAYDRGWRDHFEK